MNDIKRKELEKACKKEKNHKVRARMIAVCMVRVRNMSVERLPAFRYAVPCGSAPGCAATTKETSKASGIFPDADGSDGSGQNCGSDQIQSNRCVSDHPN